MVIRYILLYTCTHTCALTHINSNTHTHTHLANLLCVALIQCSCTLLLIAGLQVAGLEALCVPCRSVLLLLSYYTTMATKASLEL